MRIAINGFGRIGRIVSRLLAENEAIQIVAINDLHPRDSLAHLLKYDTVHRTFKHKVEVNHEGISFGKQSPQILSEKDPSKLPWAELDIDVVLECTGLFKTKEKAGLHITAGAKKVIISAPPAEDGIKTIVLGVNNELISSEDTILSNASCTTNSAAPLIQLLDELCGIESCYITTVHSYTGDQRIQDSPHADLRRGRAAAMSIVPTTTGAAKALTRIFPHLEDVMGGCGIRVPVPDGSLTDITCIVKDPLAVEQINQAFKQASQDRYAGILQYTEDPIVSSDIIDNPHSCIFDGLLTSVIGKMVKIVGWYDNEVGYSSRLIDLLEEIR